MLWFPRDPLGVCLGCGFPEVIEAKTSPDALRCDRTGSPGHAPTALDSSHHSKLNDLGSFAVTLAVLEPHI